MKGLLNIKELQVLSKSEQKKIGGGDHEFCDSVHGCCLSESIGSNWHLITCDDGFRDYYHSR